MSFGIYVQIEKGDYAAVSTTRGLTASLLLIVAGFITAVISFMGCLGAYKKMRTLLWIVSEILYYALNFSVKTRITVRFCMCSFRIIFIPYTY